MIAVIEPSFNENDIMDKKHKRAIMECTISVPTTINEESSRHNSLVPQESSRHNSLVPHVRPTPSSSINAITEGDESHPGILSDNLLTEAHAKRPHVCPNPSIEDSSSSATNNRDIALNLLNRNCYGARTPPATIV